MNLRMLASQPHLTIRALAILESLNSTGERKTRILASDLSIPKPAVTRLCDSLLEKNFLAKRSNEEDMREVFISITKEGKNFLESLRGVAT